MTRVAVLIMATATLLPQAAASDEIRHTTFPSAMIGTWAQAAEQCTTRDKSNVQIKPAEYGDASGSCAVRWIVETAGSHGPNYAVHALCTDAADRIKTQVVNIIIRPLGNNRASMGRSFEDLKIYQRCPAE